MDVGDLAAAFDELTSAGLVRDERFVAALVRDAIVADLGRGAREALHRAAAFALAAAGAEPRVVAAHLLACAPAADPEVTRWLVAAADQALDGARGGESDDEQERGEAVSGACRGGAMVPRADEAVVYLRRALDEGAPGDDRGALLAALGVAAFDAGLPEACGWLFAAADEGGVRTVDVVGRLAAFGVVAGDGDAVLDAFLDDPGEHARQIALRPGTDSVRLAHRAWAALERRDPVAPRLALAALADGRLLAEADTLRAYELCARVLVVTGHAAAERDDRGPACSGHDGADARRGHEPRGRPRLAARPPRRSRGARPHRAGLPGPVPRRRPRAARARPRRARRPRGGAGDPPRRGPRSLGRK